MSLQYRPSPLTNNSPISKPLVFLLSQERPICYHSLMHRKEVRNVVLSSFCRFFKWHGYGVGVCLVRCPYSPCMVGLAKFCCSCYSYTPVTALNEPETETL